MAHIVSNIHRRVPSHPVITQQQRRQAAESCQGLVFNIMRFSLHDGPGIRTTVFLKGCPLNCWWCHNPESRSRNIEIVYVPERCTRCGDCVRACPEAALKLDDHVIRDPHLCRQNIRCVDACPAGAQEVLGRWMSLHDIMPEVLKDQIFFDESGGGVTISGGEPLMQPDFVEALLAACRARRINTTLDTCGYAEWKVLDRIRSNVNLFLFDLKLMDSSRHQHFTGVRNDRILTNLTLLAKSGGAVVVRIPVIPGVNDGEENLTAVSSFLSEIRLRDIDLLPYHQIATGKYSRLGLEYRMEGLLPPTVEHLHDIAARLRRDGFHVQIGGSS